LPPATILFVCTGNICRSPLAEAVARRALTAHFQTVDLRTIGLHIDSAGTHALVGNPTTADMQTAATEIGLDLSRHRATQADARSVAEASLVYGMEIQHVDWLRSQPPGSPIGLLGRTNIQDPYGSELSEYRRARMEIVEAVRMRIPEMIALAS